MKFLFALCVVFGALTTPLAAETAYTLSTETSDVCVQVIIPDNYTDKDGSQIDVLLNNEKQDILGFHYFEAEGFQINNPNEVSDFTEAVVDEIFPNCTTSESSLHTSKEFSVSTNKITLMDGSSKYMYAYVGSIADEFIFGAFAFSSESLEFATSECEAFLKKISFFKHDQSENQSN